MYKLYLVGTMRLFTVSLSVVENSISEMDGEVKDVLDIQTMHHQHLSYDKTASLSSVDSKVTLRMVPPGPGG